MRFAPKPLPSSRRVDRLLAGALTTGSLMLMAQGLVLALRLGPTPALLLAPMGMAAALWLLHAGGQAGLMERPRWQVGLPLLVAAPLLALPNTFLYWLLPWWDGSIPLNTLVGQAFDPTRSSQPWVWVITFCYSMSLMLGASFLSMRVSSRKTWPQQRRAHQLAQRHRLTRDIPAYLHARLKDLETLAARDPEEAARMVEHLAPQVRDLAALPGHGLVAPDRALAWAELALDLRRKALDTPLEVTHTLPDQEDLPEVPPLIWAAQVEAALGAGQAIHLGLLWENGWQALTEGPGGRWVIPVEAHHA